MIKRKGLVNGQCLCWGRHFSVGALHAASEGHVVIVVPGRIPIEMAEITRIAMIGLRGAVIVLHLVHQAHDVGAFQRAEGARAKARQNIPIEEALMLGCPRRPLASTWRFKWLAATAAKVSVSSV